MGKGPGKSSSNKIELEVALVSNMSVRAACPKDKLEFKLFLESCDNGDDNDNQIVLVKPQVWIS